MCGENITSKTYNVRTRGSPPRVRGKHGTIKETEVKSRITPACAGKTEGGSFSSSPKKDHPRVCGENEGRHACQVFWIGSPPRVRGKLLPRHHLAAAGGITPACAGKTCAAKHFAVQREDHPRVCGENSLFSSLFSGSKGSPPRVRGKPFARFSPPLFSRITPACAGKTLASVRQILFTRDHPRVCGENYNEYYGNIRTTGSPPRVRGKPHSTRRGVSGKRITPACAGKTVELFEFGNAPEDHPRVCGENYSVVSIASNITDHPRVCGENDSGHGSGRREEGSPPRVRGKRAFWW